MFDYIKEKANSNNILKIGEDIIKNSTYIDSGAYGRIYRLNADECVKVWKHSPSFELVNKINNFTNFKLNSAVFPNNLVIIKDDIIGYTMEYINGKNLRDEDDFDFSFFIEKYNKYIRAILNELSESKILTCDINMGNIMFDKTRGKFRSVDIDSWSVSCDSLEVINNENFLNLIRCCAGFLFFYDHNDDYKKATNIDFNTDFVDFYESMRNSLEKKSYVKIKTVDDFINCVCELKR